MHAVLAILAALCAIGWLNQYVCTAAIVMWLVEKEIPFSSEDVRGNVLRVWKKVLGIK